MRRLAFLLFGLVPLVGCVRGPVLYPDDLALGSGGSPTRRVIVGEFYQTSLPDRVNVSLKDAELSGKSRYQNVTDIMAAQISQAGVSSQAIPGFKASQLKEGEVLLRGVLARRGREGKHKWANVAVPVATAVVLNLVGGVLPITLPFTFTCRYEYLVEITDREGRVLASQVGEIFADYRSVWVTAALGKCGAASQKTYAKLREHLADNIAELLVSTNPMPVP